jgi:hypothetical protein
MAQAGILPGSMMRSHRVPIAVIFAVFAVSRIAAYMAGVRFDVDPLTWYWQYIDTVLLKDRLLESLYYLHAQPPLFNLLLGLTLKAFPVSYAIVFHIEFIAMGLVSTLAFYALLAQLGVSRIARTLLTVVVSVSPAMLLYENWLFYEYPTLMLLLLAAVALHRFLAHDSTPAGIAFFALAAGLIYLRSVFQLVWLLAIVAALIVITPRRLVLTCAAIPVAVVVLLYAKNVALFGTTATSSWLGMNMARTTITQLDPEDLATLVKAGTLHAVSSIPPFSHAGAYSDIVETDAPRGVPVLDSPVKANGTVNFNAWPYLQISRDYLADALWVVRNRPQVYRTAVLHEAVPLLLSSATELDLLGENRRRIEVYDRVVGDYVYGYTPHWRRIGLVVIAVYVLAVSYAGVLIVKMVQQRRNPGAEALTVLFLVLTCVYVAAVTSLTDLGENQRMRFFLDLPIIAVVTVGITQLIRRSPAPAHCE